MSLEQRTSKSIVLTGYGGYDKLKVEYRPIPPVTPGYVQVQIMATSINFAEVMSVQGTYDRSPKTPAVLGLEAGGIVTDVGYGVTNVKKGDRVMCVKDFGLWTEFALVQMNDCFRIPDSMSFEEAASISLNYITAYQMLFDFGNLRPNKSVLVHMAAGGVGAAATQLCKTVPNVTVFGTSSVSKHEFLKQNGVTHPIDYRSKDYAEEVRKISPKGVDIVLDSLNGADAVKGYDLLKPLGKIIHFGAANAVSGPSRSLWSLGKTFWGIKSYNPLFMMSNNKAACGYHLGHLIGQPEVYADVVAELFDLFEKGQIKPVIDSVWVFEDVAKGIARIHERLNVGKVILTPNKSR